MKFRQLRNKLAGYQGRAIRWNKSGIVESARVNGNGAIEITNVLTRKTYTLPAHYQDIDVTIVQRDEMITLGDLLPKDMKKS